MPKNQIYDAQCVTVYLQIQVDLWLIVEVKYDHPPLLSQDCDVILFLSVCCTYEVNMVSWYSDDENDQNDIRDIDST